MLLDRHRVAKLIELAESEQRLTGPERMLREEDVALLVKAAYDDATDAARAEFMARVKPMPTSAWPWSAVQAMTPRGGGHGARGFLFSPAPGALAPAALVLLRGQADSADADPGNRIPDRGQPGSDAWEALHKALDLWDTATIKRSIAPQGWMTAGGATVGQVPNGGIVPPKSGSTPNSGSNGGVNTGGGQPGPQPSPVPAYSWRHPAVLVAGATTLATVGITLFALRQSRRQRTPLPPPTAATFPPTATAASSPSPGLSPSSTATTAPPQAKEAT